MLYTKNYKQTKKHIYSQTDSTSLKLLRSSLCTLLPSHHSQKLTYQYHKINFVIVYIQQTIPTMYSTHTLAHILSLLECRIHCSSFVNFDSDGGIVPSVRTNYANHTFTSQKAYHSIFYDNM